jgi:hypothetical protein
MDWHKQVITRRDLCGLLYGHSDIVCLLIQSDFIELQPSINILTWVVWLFDYPVYDSILLEHNVPNSVSSIIVSPAL